MVPEVNEGRNDLDTLHAWMTGEFSSQRQSEKDPSYYDIRLKMLPIEVEGGSDSDHWVYVEQAMAGMEGSPYRQRAYRLTTGDDGTLESHIYRIRDGEELVGTWEDGRLARDLTTDDLEGFRGNVVYLHRENDAFVGGTRGKECENSYGGAVYATTELVIDESGMYAWDRGYNERDEQVWGPEDGGYAFDKVSDVQPILGG